jgi:4-hydroxyphenylpyruvate dioxygenase
MPTIELPIENKIQLERKPNPLGIEGFDFVEFYVGNAHQAAHFYRTAYGFKVVAYSGLETGRRDQVSYVLEQGSIRLVLTATLRPDDQVSAHLKRHGDGVKDVALRVKDIHAAFHHAIRCGARPVMEPTVFEDDSGQIIKATIGAYGDTVHSLVQRSDYEGPFFPTYAAINKASPSSIAPHLISVDHVAVSLGAGMLDEWVEFYERVMGFHVSHQENVNTGKSSMRSKAVQSWDGKIKFPLVEPVPGGFRSQIEEYLEYHQGPGVQHVALLSSDILKTVGALRSAGNEFLRTPDAYYEMLGSRVGTIDENVDELHRENILVDRDDSGYLMQIFSKPLQSRPTLFMEAIQRKGACGFGAGNIKALFEALEREQANRGNLLANLDNFVID